MTCAELDDRLFDEDCRSARAGRSEVPRDVADHLASCPRCAQEWSRAAAEAARLSGLLVAPSPALHGRLVQVFHSGVRDPAPAVGTGVEMLFGTIAFGALGAALAVGVTGISQWAGFAVAASLGLTVEAVRRARPTWRAPVASASRVLQRCLDALVSVA